jgi:TonB-linked SusC/RagA family outer membrane protein
MKKKLRLLLFSHLHDRLGLIMRFSFLMGMMATIPLSSYGTFSNTGTSDVSAPQQVRVTGTITDATTGEALVGVNVVVDGTTTGVSTDINGKYSIAVPNLNGSLQVSYIGYVAQKISVNGRMVVDVVLTSDILALEDVVVVGYGSVRKSDLTGSVSSVKPTELLQLPTQRVDQALQGRTTGVFILNTDGSPGGNTMIRIRGLNSINGGNEPLIIVDGLQGANINQLNPNDIASMEILKDASATAIYGSRGANGVILITTKLGKLGKPTIDAGYNIGFQKLARKLPVMNAGDFARMFNTYRMTQTGSGNIPTPEFSSAQIAEFDAPGGSTDWQDEVYQIGVLQNTNLAISGATDKLKYMISTNYLDHQGILLKSQYNRLSLRANLAADITDWVDFGLNYSYTRELYESPPFKDASWTSQVVNNAPRWAPTEPVYDANGNYWRHRSGYGASDTWNPMASAVEPIIDNPNYQNNANLFLNFKLYKGLSLKIMGGGTFSSGYYRDYYNLKTRQGSTYNGFGNYNNSVDNRFQNTNILTYDNTFGVHHITFTGVVEQIQSISEGGSMSGRDFLVDQLGFNNMDGASTKSIDTYKSERALMSYMGRVNYGLMDKYLVTLSYRADGSSVFGSGNKWGYFPSGSVAWRISQENFLKDSPVVSDLKLRASYGVTGNQGIGPYGSLARLGSGSGWNYPWNGGLTNIGFGIADIANPKLKWETTSQSDIGVDVSLFKGRLTSTVDVYKKVTKDLLMPRELPGYIGVSSVLDNIGSIQNTGLEIMVSGDPLVGELKWNTSFNISLNRNKVLDLGDQQKISYSASYGGYGLDEFMFLEVGQPFGLMNGWKYLGMWRSDQAAEALEFGQLPGMPHYADLSGKDGVPDGKIDAYDRTNIGNGYPKFTWGFTNLFTYKGFELSFLLMGSHGNDLFNTIRIRRESFWEGNDPKLMNYWTVDNQNTDIPALYDGKWLEEQLLVSKVSMSSSVTSQWVEDASYIRLKTLTLAYSFEQRLLKSIGFSKARIYCSGTNLLTFTKYTGYDPEVAAFSGNDATIGVDFSVYPSAKALTFGIDFTF